MKPIGERLANFTWRVPRDVKLSPLHEPIVTAYKRGDMTEQDMIRAVKAIAADAGLYMDDDTGSWLLAPQLDTAAKEPAA